MDDLTNQLASTGLGLAILGATYLVWLLTGVANNLFSTKKWSFKRMLEDIAKTALMAVAILAWVAVMNMTNWFTIKMGADISTLLDGASVAGVIGGIIGGSVYYLSKGYKNIINFVNTNHVEVAVIDPDYAGVAEEITKFIGSVRATDETGEAEKEVEETGKGATADNIDPLSRVLPDGDNDNGKGWQCSKYSYYLATGVRMNYAPHPDYGPVNGNAMVDYLVSKCGYVYCGKEKGAIFSTMDGTYGHTGIVLDPATNKISNANYNNSLAVSTNNYSALDNSYTKFCKNPNIKREPDTLAPTPAPAKSDTVSYTYKQGDTFGQVILNLGLNTNHGLWGADGDVAYYTKQLNEQGIYGNIPIGTTIKLTRRK